MHLNRADYVCCIILLVIVDIIGTYKVTDKLHDIRKELKDLKDELNRETKIKSAS